jgi:hypothetical protein
MANMCSNSVIFTIEDSEKFKHFREFLDKAEKANHKGQLPFITTEEDAENGYKVPDSWFFDLENNCEDRFIFESKWSCPIDTMVKCGREFGFSFEVEYEVDSQYGKYQFDYNDDEVWHKETPEDLYVKLSESEDDNMYEELDATLDALIYEPYEPYDDGE